MPPTPLRRELLVSLAVLLGGALLVSVVGLVLVLPILQTPGQTLAYVLVLLAGDVAILFLFGNMILRSRLVKPVQSLVADVQRIAAGDYLHRVGGMSSSELRSIQESVNRMADRLIRNQDALAENVESLDRTNQELVEARDQVIQTARLASVGTLAAGIAHEVGNPLGAIMAYVDVARHRIEEAGGDADLLLSIRDEAWRIDRIVRGLLDYARPRDLEPEPIHPARVMERVREILDSQGKLDGVDHQWELDTPGVPPVLMEPHRLEQVMVNLILNALHAMDGLEEPGFTVSLAWEPGDVSRLPIRREDDPPGVNYMHRRRVARSGRGQDVDPLFTARRVAVIRVADRGPGIPQEDLERVFDPFYTTKEPGQGTGLGLAICARLVEGMGGRIDAARAGEDGGAQFTIRLPGTSEGDTTE